MTVADYFADMARQCPAYQQAMGGSRLKYPFLPTVNIGSAKKPILMPMELLSVRPGQSFSKLSAEMTAQVVRIAAIPPQERFRELLDCANKASSGGQSMLAALRSNAEAESFGVTDFPSQPMSVAARLLPPPQLQYGDQVCSPGLAGEWNIMTGARPPKFAELPPRPLEDGTYMYGILLVSRGEPRDWDRPTRDLKAALEKDAASAGLKLHLGGPPMISSGASLFLAAVPACAL